MMNLPEGWPTEEMIDSGVKALNNGWYINADETCAAIFKAMLAADSIPLVLPAPEFQGAFDSEGSRVGEILQLETQLSDQDVKALHDYIARVTPPAQNYVKMPTTAEEAELMAKLGMMWLEQNVPDRLKTPPAQDQWQQAVLNECMSIEGCYVEADPAKTVKCLIDWHVMNERNYSPAQEDEAVGYVSAGAMKSLGDKESDGQTIFPRKGMIYNIPLYTRPSSELRKAAEELFDGQFLDGCVITQSLAHKLGKLRAALDKK